MEGEINDINDLIGKVLTGEASNEELTRLDAWASSSPENRKYVEEVKHVFEKSAAVHANLEFDTEAAWNKVRTKMERTPRTKQLPRTSSFVRIAAAIAVLLAAGVLGYRQFSQPIQTLALSTAAAVSQDTLPDGSRALLNKRSSITYEYNPRKKVRRVRLEGESYFEVKHEEEKPFIIEAQEVLIRDIGTTFNVAAWPEKDTIEVTVQSGEVQFYTLLDSGLTLHAGETGIYSRRAHAFSRLESVDVNVLSYQTGELKFVNADLKSVVRKINQVYDSKIILENPALENCRLTVSFHHDTLDTIIEVIAETMKLSITRRDNEILLDGKGCNQ